MTRKKWSYLLFAMYCAAMLWLLFGQRMGQGSDGILQLRPFSTIRRFLWVLEHSSNLALRRTAWINLAGNVVMFVPLGFFCPCLWKWQRNFFLHFLTMTLVIAGIELLQLKAALGTCDVDDLMLNLLGTTLGLLLWKLWHWITK